ncbi:MAG: flippase [Gemmatimonadaceae bacterium]|nr:flippase [Gemmatimonadaceae bacterium]
MADEASSAAGTPRAPSLMRNGAFSLVTSAAPIPVALIALPLLTRHLGTERLGLLALAWAWLGYATLLDFGLGRALTRMVAANDAGSAIASPIRAYVATAHVTLTIVGLLVGLLGAVVAPWYVTHVLQVSAVLRSDAVMSSVLFALSVPAVTGASAPRAVLEARQRFTAINFVRLPVSVGTFLVPLLLLPFTASLTVIAATLAGVRLWAWWRYASLARAELTRSPGDGAATAYLRPLLRAGAWMTVSNVLSPLMTVADRFLIGSFISVSAVALYAVPWEAITKLWIVPGALMMVVFPAVAAAAESEPGRMAPLYAAAVRLLTALVVPACCVACLLAPWLLQLAGGAQYSGDSVTVLRILAIGLAANCIAAAPITILQASGRAKWTATLHLLEVVPFALLLWVGVQRAGIVGVAAAWSIRAVCDALLLAALSQRVAALPVRSMLLSAGGVASVALCAWLGSALIAPSARLPLAGALAVTLLAPVVLWMQRPASERLVLGPLGGAP